MTKRKETSTNTINRDFLHEFCAAAYAINLLEGRWKMVILYKLEGRTLRFSQLKQLMPKISERMLARQLKELESDQLIKRTLFASVPATVIYELTESGQALAPLWKSLEAWGLSHRLHHPSSR